MEVEVGWWIVDEVLVVFGIVASVECPLSVAECAVYVAGFFE